MQRKVWMFPVRLKVDESDQDTEAMSLLLEYGDVKSLSKLKKKFLEKLDVVLQKESELEILRKQFVKDFNIQNLMNMTLEEYVVGLHSKESFCYRIENQLLELGDIRSVAGSNKFGVYFSQDEGKHLWTKRYGDNLDAAFDKVKKEIVMLVMVGNQMDYEKIKNNMLSSLLKERYYIYIILHNF